MVIVTLQQSGYALGVATIGTLFLSMKNDNIANGFGWAVGIEAAIAAVVTAGSFLRPAATAPGANIAVEV